MSLSEFVDDLQRKVRYTFTRAEAASALDMSDAVLTKALQRLGEARRIHQVRRGFYVIVPLEHSKAGTIPTDWFIGDLMAFVGRPYYVGVLSAAATYGAAHQRPQEYQVVVPVTERLIETDRLRIRFFRNAFLESVSTNSLKTFTGTVPVSTAEHTALDLVRFMKWIGGLDAVLTVLSELGERIDADALVGAAEKERVVAYVQRLGWLLERAGWSSVTGPLAEWVADRRPGRVPLDAGARARTGERVPRWQVILNEIPEGEL